jgi:hypothetical protein
VEKTTIEIAPWPPTCRSKEAIMKQSDHFRDNAENCAHLAELAASEPVYLRYKRMEAAWRALAHEQDWLDGEVSPIRRANGTALNIAPPR